jgi:hypothetical protein
VFAYSLQDIETFDLEDFKYNFVNMTAFRIVDAEDVGVREILRDMERFQPVGHSILNKSRIIQVSLSPPRQPIAPYRRCAKCETRALANTLPVYGAIYAPHLSPP